jgi:hypothetical protein
MQRTILLVVLMLTHLASYAQFKLINDAAYMPNGCIQLTPDVPYAEGIAYSTTKLDLTKHFEIEFDLYFGNKDEDGADGITFVIHNDRRGFEAFGTWGECIGYGTWSREYGGTYIAPSIAIEFDTYHNPRQNDPLSDHVAYLENGSSAHTKYWNNNDSNFNLEDDMLHSFKLRWNPEKKRITTYLDGEIVFEGIRDLVKDIFKGETKVIWGFTSSTGRKHNLQYFCLKRLVQRTNPIEPTTVKVKPPVQKDESQQAQSRR